MRAAANCHRRAFTLVELLVVISIIAVLSAIVAVVGNAVIKKAHETTMAIEISNLEQAIESYKAQHKGSHPPDFTTLAGVQDHFRRAYPKANAVVEINDFLNDPNQDGNNSDAITVDDLDASEALVFFLGGGLYDNQEYPLTGGADPAATPPVQAVGKRISFFEFDEDRLIDLESTPDGFPSYVPKFGKGTPYVYFDSRNYGHAKAVFPKSAPVPVAGPGVEVAVPGFVRPYRSTFPLLNSSPAVNKWANDNTYQIITAGLDAHFGDNKANKIFPTAVDTLTFKSRINDRDNIANFSEGGTFEDRLP